MTTIRLCNSSPIDEAIDEALAHRRVLLIGPNHAAARDQLAEVISQLVAAEIPPLSVQGVIGRQRLVVTEDGGEILFRSGHSAYGYSTDVVIAPTTIVLADALPTVATSASGLVIIYTP